MSLTELTEYIQLRLLQPLPGSEAQLSFYSEHRILDYERVKSHYDASHSEKTARQSSVLILLYEKENQIYIPLIKRPEYDGVHSGQIALPGGKVEPTDSSIVHTALRETEEEIGVHASEVSILGTLTPVYIPPSNFWVNVVIGYHRSTPTFVPDPHEVSAILEFPITHLTTAMQLDEREVVRRSDFRMKAPGIVVENDFIWGATFMMLSELKVLLNRVQ